MERRRGRPLFSLFDKTGLDANTVITLRLLILAVIGGIIWSNITTGIAMTGYLKDLGITDFAYGVVIALPSIFNAFQFAASYRMERTLKRRRMFLISGFLQRAIWLPFALIPFVIPMSEPRLRLSAACLCAAISAASAPFMNVSFYSICADVIPIRIRGRYFASRSRVATSIGLLVGIGVGFLLDAMSGFEGYCIVFLLASVCGVLDVVCFLFMPLPPLRETERHENLFRMIGRVIRDKPYMRIVTAITAWNFAVMISSPYFNVYMRDSMRMSNIDIMLLGQITGNLFLVLAITRWGRAIDHQGSRPILCTAAILTSFMPILYFFTGPNMLIMVFLANALSGATYCAIDLSAQNLFIGQAREENKSMYFAVYFLFSQLFGSALGSAAGGYLLDNILGALEPAGLYVFGFALTRYNYLFILSALLRFIVIFFLFLRIREDGATPVRQYIRSGISGAQRIVFRFLARRMRNSGAEQVQKDIK